jgi:hypothetical protein
MPSLWRSNGSSSVGFGVAVLAVIGILATAAGSLVAQQGGAGGRGAGAQQGAPAPQGRAGGRGNATFDEVLVGVIDVHAHSGPDSRPRSIDFLDAVRYAKLKGMRGLVLKHHLDPTAGYAYIARKEVPGFEAFGLIDLNWPAGGMNAAAVEHFVQVSMPGLPPEGYGRVVMMGSDDAPYQLQVSKSNTPGVVVVRNGEVVPEAKAIIGLIKKYNLTLTTGHHSGPEAVIIVREAIKQGIPPQRIGVTHANIDPPGLTVEQMQEVAKMGAFVEMCGQSQRALTPEAQKALDARDDRIADLIKKVGPEHVILETDLGQANNEYHPDGIAAFVRNMRARGITPAETDMMTKRNPARYLGIPEPSTAGTQ